MQKPENQKDFEAASATLGFVLLETSKLIAPFSPFFAEALYGAMENGTRDKDKELSVHLADLPQADLEMIDKKLIEAMAEVRRVASIAFAKRAEAGIKVRQPLAELRIKGQGSSVKTGDELLEILKDEVNVKEIVFDTKLKDEVELDTVITPALREEGLMREFVRLIQVLRQDVKLRPTDVIVVMLELPDEATTTVSKNEKLLKSEVNAKTIEYKKSTKFDAEIKTKLDGQDVWVGVKRS